MHACDGRTDRQTDRILIARPRLHSMQRGKNELVQRTFKSGEMQNAMFTTLWCHYIKELETLKNSSVLYVHIRNIGYDTAYIFIDVATRVVYPRLEMWRER